MLPPGVALVFPDGRAVAGWDAIEAAALREVFGAGFERLTCSVPRTQFGHSLAAAGALDTICALLALQDNVVPPTVNCDTPHPEHCPPGLVRELSASLGSAATGALVCARGLGGSHAVLALKKALTAPPCGAIPAMRREANLFP